MISEISKKRFTANEVKEIISSVKRNMFDETVAELLLLQNMNFDHDVQMRKMIFVSGFWLLNTSIKGGLYLGNSIFKDGLEITGGEIHHLDLSDAIIEKRLTISSTFIPGTLHLDGISLKGSLDISINDGPQKIFVSSNMAELVHWAAPTIPLVIVK